MIGDGNLSIAAHLDRTEPAGALLAVLFAPGQRPSLAQIEGIAKRTGAFAVSFAEPVAQGTAEALVTGLTFDVGGLAPAASDRIPATRHHFGLGAGTELAKLEALTIVPGVHLAGGEVMLPVVRGALALAAAIAGEGARAVIWSPAGSAMEPQYFAAIVADWLAGGAFPALGLTALTAAPDGSVTSDGLAFFIGQELVVSGRAGVAVGETIRLATRAIHALVGHGRVESPLRLTGPAGETLVAEPSPKGDTIHLWQQD